MLIKVKTNYGLDKGGYSILKTPNDPPFEVSDAKGYELVKIRKIAEEVEEKTNKQKNSSTSDYKPTGDNIETEETLAKKLGRTSKANLINEAVANGIEPGDMTAKQIIALLIPVLLAKQGSTEKNNDQNQEG